MTELESAIVATLRAEAEEAAMTTDTPDQFEILSDRLDDVDGADRRRRRSWAVVGAVAAAAAVAVAAVAVLGRSAPPPAAPVEPATGPLFRATGFQPAFSANLPAWVAEVMTAPTEQTADTVTWNRCEERPVCIGLDAYTIRYLTRGSTEPATYAGYLARMEELRRAGALDVTDSRQTTVDGRPATVYSLLTNGDTADGMGCFTTLRCQDFYTDNLARYAVVDTGSAPLVIGMRTFVENPQGQVWIDQLDGMLATLRLSSPAYPGVSELIGTYEATLTQSAAAARPHRRRAGRVHPGHLRRRGGGSAERPAEPLRRRDQPQAVHRRRRRRRDEDRRAQLRAGRRPHHGDRGPRAGPGRDPRARCALHTRRDAPGAGSTVPARTGTPRSPTRPTSGRCSLPRPGSGRAEAETQQCAQPARSTTATGAPSRLSSVTR